jgi:predicted DNA-binding ribbon-helix-helix protein
MAQDFSAAFQSLLDSARTGASETVFKALTVDGNRRALRLEKSFWSALELVAREHQLSVNEVIAYVAEAGLNEKNLSSALRHMCIHAMTQKVSEDQSWFSENYVQHLINACPSPVFALTATRQLRFTNQAFLKYVRTNFVGADLEGQDASLKLQIDLPMDQLIDRLRQSKNQPVSVGFAIGLNERRVRGSINALLAPDWKHQIVLGFVVN